MKNDALGQKKPGFGRASILFKDDIMVAETKIKQDTDENEAIRDGVSTAKCMEIVEKMIGKYEKTLEILKDN